MLAMPLMVLLFALSFTEPAKRRWQEFFCLFAIVGITLMYISLLLVGTESWFRVEQATMSFMFFIALVGMAPFITIYMLGVGALIVVLHASYVASFPQLGVVHAWFYSLFVFASYVIACTAAWVREKSWRSDFMNLKRT
jgi:hypothetical protein